MRQLADVLVPDWSLGLIGFVPGGAVPCDGGCAFHPSRLRPRSTGSVSPEKPEPAAFVDVGSGNHRTDNGAGGARPAGETGARISLPRVLP